MIFFFQDMVVWLSSSDFNWNIHPLPKVSSAHQPSSRTLFTCWYCLMSSQSLLRDGCGLYSLWLYTVASLTEYFLFSLSSLEPWLEIIWSGEQVWTDKGLLWCGLCLPAIAWRLLTAQCGVALGLWSAFASIRDCSTWKHDATCQICLSLGCCNLHLMVLMGSACQLHWELRESFKLLRIRLLVKYRLSRSAFLCGYLMEVELK